MMHLVMFALLVTFVMIYAVGHWVLREVNRRRAWEVDVVATRHAWEAEATADRGDIRKIAETAHREISAHNAILEQFPSTADRHLRIVQNHDTTQPERSYGRG
jgi:hypothetical protein